MSLKARTRSRSDNAAYPYNGGYWRLYYKDYFKYVFDWVLQSVVYTPNILLYGKSGKMLDYVGDQPIRRLQLYPNTLNSDIIFKDCRHNEYLIYYVAGKPWRYTAPLSASYPYNSYLESDGCLNNRFVRWGGGHSILANGVTNQFGKVIEDVGFYAAQFPSAIAKLKSMLSDSELLGLKDVNMLAFIGELKDLRQLLNFFKLKHIDDKTVSDKFLGFNLGVLPMYGDIKAILKIITNLEDSVSKWNSMAASNRVFNKHATFLNTTVKSTSPVVYTSGWENGGPLRYRMRAEFTYEQTVVGRCHFYFRARPIAPDQISSLRNHLLGFHKVLGAIWELIPFSFIVDWFIKIGDAIDQIEAATPILGAEIVSAGYSCKMETTTVVKYFVEFNDGTLHGMGREDYFRRDYQRTGVSPSSILTNGQIFGPMGFSADVSAYKVGIATALLHQRLRS